MPRAPLDEILASLAVDEPGSPDGRLTQPAQSLLGTHLMRLRGQMSKAASSPRATKAFVATAAVAAVLDQLQSIIDQVGQ